MDGSMATIFGVHKSSGVEGGLLGGSMLSGSAGVLDLDQPLHHHSDASMHHHHPPMPHHLQSLAPLSSTQHLSAYHDSDQSTKLEGKGTPITTLSCSRGKSSDDDEPSFIEEGDYLHGGKGKKSSPWQRVKWTDAMIQLLIKVVLLVGEDGGVEGSEGYKRKSGLLQKKGKWKSVSSVMNESGYCVSPQQCEDKFNDLNKRYKRLNDILGRDTALKVVENPALLETLHDLSLKVKEDVKKILSSKHLFYREMCSYHSGYKSLVSTEFEFQPSATRSEMLMKERYVDYSRPSEVQNDVDEGEEDDVDEQDEDDGYEDCDAENSGGNVCNFPSPLSKKQKQVSYDDGFQGFAFDYTKNIGFNIDVPLMMQSGLSSEHRQLLGRLMMQLEEQKVSLQAQALELEKHRFKWQKFNMKRDQELEKVREENKKMKLENERLALELKQQVLNREAKRVGTSMASLDSILGRLHSKEQPDSLGQVSGY